MQQFAAVCNRVTLVHKVQDCSFAWSVSYATALHLLSLHVVLQLARIIEQDRPKAKAVVELVLTNEVLSVHFDNICEFVGDVEDMDM